MGDKIFKNILLPYLKVTIPVFAALCCIIIYFNTIVGLCAFAVVAFLVLLYLHHTKKQVTIAELFAEEMLETLDKTLHYSIENNPLPLCVIDKSGNVSLINAPFKEIYEKAENLTTDFFQLTGLRSSDFFTEDPIEKPVMVTHDERTYKVIPAYLDGERNNNVVLYWIEVTSFEKLKVFYNEEKNCYAYVNIDSFEELLANIAPEKRSELMVQVEKIIRQWASKISAAVTKHKEGQYFIIFENKHYDYLETTKFSILDDIREIETETDFPVSLSIGIGMGGKNPAQQEEYAATALDLALGRGGDQAVVKRVNKIDYFGGKLQTFEKRNKGKSRIMAHALRRLIDQSSKVIIMGHKKPDMDCFGAAIGVSRIAKNRGKEAFIVMNPKNETLVEMYDKAVESGNYKFISSETAAATIDKDTLLIIVDTHRPSMIESAELLKRTEKLVVIDHHRKAEDSIENAILTYMEAYASSTSELITEILQYTGDKKEVEKFEAEALLAGIIVDTNRFSIKTGVRTFEAASWLRRMGADTQTVRKAFQTELESIKIRAQIVSNVEILENGIAISKCAEKIQDVQVINSQAADEILNIKGVKGCFVLGENEQGVTVISGRSLGDVNVQLILEKLGGGGNLTKAGAQVEAGLEETIEKLKEIILEGEQKNDRYIDKRR